MKNIKKSKAMKKYWKEVKSISKAGHLTIKASRKAYREKTYIDIPIAINNKYTYHIKLIYDSPRETTHGIMTEFILIMIREDEPSENEVRDFISMHMEEIAKGDDFLLGIPFNYVVGLSSVEPTDEEESHEFKQIKYSHDL